MGIFTGIAENEKDGPDLSRELQNLKKLWYNKRDEAWKGGMTVALEQWCVETEIPSALEPVGSLKSQSMPKVLDGMMGALMLQGSEMGGDIEEVLEEQNLRLPDLPYRVCQFSLDDPRIELLRGKKRYYCRLGMYRCLQDHLMGTLEHTIGGFLVLMMGGLFAVLYTDPASDYIYDACKEAVEYAGKDMDFQVHVSISSLWEGTNRMESAYRMLRDAEQSRSFYTGVIDRVFVIPDTALQRIGDTAQRTEFERGFFQTAERICGAVQAENVQATAAQLRMQLERIAENCIGMPYPITINLTINRFMMLLQSQLVEQNLANWRYITQADYSRTLSAAGTLEAYLAAGERIAAELVTHARELRQDQRDSLLRDIRTYVIENATDMNMGLTAVAREFRLKPREAAESFRLYYGESINDVIHKARVKKARELLLTTDTPVQDIATAVGYCSLATMYRAFTNVEGIAPGKLRQSRLKDRKPEDGESEAAPVPAGSADTPPAEEIQNR